MLAPNKQNLLLLRGQIKVVNNGLKLLKEKRNGLIAMFLSIAKEGKVLEYKLQSDQQKILSLYNKSMTFTSTESLLSALQPKSAKELKILRKRVSGVYIESLDIKIYPQTRNNLKINLRKSLGAFANSFADILKVSQLRLNITRVSNEIQKTNRQINNLEIRLENIKTQIKYINSALSEKENLEKATLIKIFSN
jgi:V/A-type H+/Na+-transporting ATPase subunit D